MAKKKGETDAEILARIRTVKAARKRNPLSNGHHVRLLQKLLGEYMKVGQTYSIGDIEVFIEKSGGRFTSAGPTMSYAVELGYFDRVGKGQYKVTGKKLEAS